MATPRTLFRPMCFVCARKEGEATVIRFGLRQSWTVSGRAVNRMRGGIYLCEQCWKEAQLVRPRRGPRPGHNKGARNVPGKRGFQPTPTEVAA